MSEPDHTHITTPLLARGFDVNAPLESAARYSAAARIIEMSVYEEAASLVETDTDYAHRIVLLQVEPAYPGIKARLLRDITATMARKADAERPGGMNDQARSALFMTEPGRYLTGAKVAPVRLGPPGFGYVEVDGVRAPWTYVAAAYARSDLAELVDHMDRLGFERGYAVGAPGVAKTLTLPAGIVFVEVALEGRAA